MVAMVELEGSTPYAAGQSLSTRLYESTSPPGGLRTPGYADGFLGFEAPQSRHLLAGAPTRPCEWVTENDPFASAFEYVTIFDGYYSALLFFPCTVPLAPC